MAFRPYEDPYWDELEGRATPMGEVLTASQMQENPNDSFLNPNHESWKANTWVAPTLSNRGGIEQEFSHFKMTPGSPSVKEQGEVFNFADSKFSPEMLYAEEPPVTDNYEDPGKSLSNLNTMLSYGGNGYTPAKVTPPPPMKIQAQQAMEQEGKQVMFDMNKIPAWHESDAFSTGLLSFGLNLLSGNDLATSFNQAAGAFDKSFGKEKRQAWAQDLVEQGYDAHEIQSWIETGDHKALTDPMQKKMQQQQYQLGQMQLQRAMYENSPEYMDWQTQRQLQKDQMEINKFEADERYRAASLGLQQAQLKLSEFTAKQKANEFTSRDFTQMRSTVQTGLRTMEQKLVQSRLADKSLDDLQAAIKRGDNAAAQGAYQSFREYQARAMLGGNATLTPKAIEEVTGLPSKVDTVINLGGLWSSGEPSDKWVKTQRANVSRALDNEHYVAEELVSNAYRTWRDEYGHDKAQQAVRRVAAGTNLGQMTFNPKTGVMEKPNAKKYEANANTVMIYRK